VKPTARSGSGGAASERAPAARSRGSKTIETVTIKKFAVTSPPTSMYSWCAGLGARARRARVFWRPYASHSAQPLT